VDNFSRFDRRLFPYSYFPQVRKFLRFVWEDRVYAFRTIPFGLSTAPLVFTRICSGSGSPFTQPVNFHPFLFELFPVELYLPISSERSYPFCDRVAPQTGFPNFMEEVGASFQPRFHFSRGTSSDRTGTSVPPRGKHCNYNF
jgi:hypothetical protein